MSEPKQINPSLSDEQKAVLLEKATERPFTGKFLHNKDSGMYTCANCGGVLFSSDTKFSAPPPNEGWPSFSDVAQTGAVTLTDDTRYGMHRVEVTCTKCGGHLGHYFDDGPSDAEGRHYCINSAALDFKQVEKN